MFWRPWKEDWSYLFHILSYFSVPRNNSYIDDIKWKNAEGICLKRVCIICLEKNSFSTQDMFKVTGNKVKAFFFFFFTLRLM